MTRSPSPARSPAATRAAVAVIVAGLAARLVLAVLLDPGLDEAYAIAVSRQVALSWFDHPPMTFWWVAAVRALAAPWIEGSTPVLLLRLPFVVAFTATSWLVFDLTRRLWGGRAGLWALAALTLAPFFLVSAGSWIVPDGPLLLFLALAARLLVEILFQRPDPIRERRLWLAAGLALGLAGLSKYHTALFAFGAFAFLLVTPHRHRLAAPAPWIAAAIAVVVVLPVVIWNAENGWVSFLFQSSRGLGGRGINWLGVGRMVLGEMAYLAPWTLVAAILATVTRLRAERTLAGPTGFLLFLALPAIAIFTAVPLRGGDGLPHWSMSGWLFLLPVLGKAIAERESRRHGPSRLAHGFAVAATALLTLAAAGVAFVRLAPPSPATVERLHLGGFLAESVTWRGLAEGIAQVKLPPQIADPKLPPGPQAGAHGPVVVAFRWIEAARIAEALGPTATVMVFDDDPRGFAFLADPLDFLGRDLILVGRPTTFERGVQRVAPFFAAIDPQPAIPVKLGDTTLFEAQVAIGRLLKQPYPLPYPKR